MTRRTAPSKPVTPTAPRTLPTEQLAQIQGGAIQSYAAGKYGIDACDYDGNVQAS